MKTITSFDELDLTKAYTYADYLHWKFSERVELIRGWVRKMSPAPNLGHQTLSFNLSGAFFNSFRSHSCRVFTAPFDVRLPLKSATKDTTVVQPDLCVICDEAKLDKRGCNGAPDLIVEILSPGNGKYDLDTKFKLYEEAGVLEYWIIEPLERLILVYALKDEKYVGSKPFLEGENIQSILFPDLNIAVADVFYRVGKD